MKTMRLRAVAVFCLGQLFVPCAALAPYPACTPEFIEKIVANMGPIHPATNCPDATWKTQFLTSPSMLERTTPVTVFDVGCNKALDALTTISLLDQDFSVTKDMWFKYSEFGDCGSCMQCQGQPQVIPGSKKQRVDLYCIEALPSNFERINRTANHFDMAERGLHLVYAAFTSSKDADARNGTAKFPHPNDPTFHAHGHEAAGIDVHWCCNDCPMVEVPLMVFDYYVAHLQYSGTPVHDIDILSIDTEGNDPLVLQGAHRALRRVRYLEFEVHDVGFWAKHSLDPVLHSLEQMHFVCYWLGKGKLWRISGCWHPSYSRNFWSNVGCVKESDSEWLDIMQNIFTQTVPH